MLDLIMVSVEALVRHVELCSSMGLACIDPPLFSTRGFLERIEYRGYRLRRVLREAREACPADLYTSPYSRLALTPSTV